MNYIKGKSYLLFLALAVLLLSFGFYKGDEMLDINIHDTYFIISWKHLMILIALLLFFCNVIYALVKRKS
ncbi:hypothetical protein [Flavobacterium ustbae]|uniref:hypothetical protein n=1 Tax=Flavobacterium ustbae TaxID=2488790 RepID=UPI000F7B0D17|nr:hypothetical protein [Flavobacterium ustbae]